MKIRLADPDDTSLILEFITKKSEFDRDLGAYSGVLQVSKAKILQTMFHEIPFAYVLFAERKEQTLGFALYGFRYSSFMGQPSIWLDDLYVDEGERSQGVGLALMNYLRQISQKNNCSHLAWTADARNIRGINFYHRLGAKIIEQRENRCFFQWVSYPKS